MNTPDYQFQLLLDQTTALYNSERELSGVFDALRTNANGAHLREGILLEAQENKKHCERLEGLINVLNRHPHKTCSNETSWKNFVDQFHSTLNRIVAKHTNFGYKTAIFVALALGQNEIANFLKCLSDGSLITVK